PAPPPTDEQPTRILTEPDSDSQRPTEAVSDDISVPPPDEPFSPLDSTVRRPRVGLARAPDMPAGEGLSPVKLAGFGEEATLIRRQPTAPLAPPDDWGEAPTVIKAEPSPTTRRPPPPRHPDRPSVSITQPAASNRPVPGPPPRAASDTVARRRTPATSWQVHAGYMVLVVLCSVLMLFVGVLVTRWRLDSELPVTGAVVKHEPQLRVELPEGATLRVDGRPVPGESPVDVVLTAGEPHRVEVELEGYNPYETRVTLAENDVRVLSIQTECLQPQRR
ncbi:MAG: PEGA domain-containing protein, partial [Deltaproteobacteria bacterium]